MTTSNFARMKIGKRAVPLMSGHKTYSVLKVNSKGGIFSVHTKKNYVRVGAHMRIYALRDAYLPIIL